MEIDVTNFFHDWGDQFFDLCHGPDAWKRALKAASSIQDSPQYGSAMLEAARAHFREYGAWTAEELAAFSDREICAMIAQDIANDACDENTRHSFSDERNFFYLGI